VAEEGDEDLNALLAEGGDEPPAPVEEEEPEEYSKDEEEEEEKEEYKCKDKPVVKMSRTERDAEREKYRRIEAERDDLREKYARLRKTMQEVTREKTDADRLVRLEQLAIDRAIDLDAEKDRCLYSRGADMTEVEFDAHVQTIERYAAKSAVGARLPEGEVDPAPIRASEDDAEKYQKAVEYADQMRRENKRISWDDALAYVEGNGAAK